MRSDDTPKEVISKLVEIFLDVPFQEIEVKNPTNRPLEGIGVLDAELIDHEANRVRLDKIFKLIESYNFNTYWIAWLFEELEHKAIIELNAYSALAQTTDPDKIKNQVNHLPKSMVEAKKQSMKYEGRVKNSKAGSISPYSDDDKAWAVKHYNNGEKQGKMKKLLYAEIREYFSEKVFGGKSTSKPDNKTIRTWVNQNNKKRE